jgi:hypothetical protein
VHNCKKDWVRFVELRFPYKLFPFTRTSYSYHIFPKKHLLKNTLSLVTFPQNHGFRDHISSRYISPSDISFYSISLECKNKVKSTSLFDFSTLKWESYLSNFSSHSQFDDIFCIINPICILRLIMLGKVCVYKISVTLR